MFKWLICGDITHRWQHGVMCVLWLTMALLWCFHAPPHATANTRAFNLAFCAFAFGYQLRCLDDRA